MNLAALNLQIGGIELKPVLKYRSHDPQVKFNPTESMLLYLLSARSPEVVSRAELEGLVSFMTGNTATSRDITRVYISYLRRKLNSLEAGAGNRIKKTGNGYMLDLTVPMYD
jgi:DNA-binding response OmpR family regulator